MTVNILAVHTLVLQDPKTVKVVLQNSVNLATSFKFNSTCLELSRY